MLIEFNPWWEVGEVPKEYLPEKKRFLFKELRESLSKRYISAIIGLRRTGKTTLMYQLIDYLIKTGVDPRYILYFSFDERMMDLRNVIHEYEVKIIKDTIRSKKAFLFFDEIQKLEDWPNKIKILYDLYPKAKIFISGSASLTILGKGRESLAGRAKFFYLGPLSFLEFLYLKGEEKIIDRVEIYERKIKTLLNLFLKRGFPEIIDATDKEAEEYAKELVLNRIIFRDIPEYFKVRDIEALKVISEYLFSNPGIILNINSLSRDLGRSRVTISNILNYMEITFLIRSIKNLRGSFLSASRKLKKVYPIHPCFCFTKDESKIIECLIASEINAEYYWRKGGKEVDFVIKNKEVIPIEVKYKDKINRRDLSGILSFMNIYKIKKGIMITKNIEEERNGMSLVPLIKFVLSKEEYIR